MGGPLYVVSAGHDTRRGYHFCNSPAGDGTREKAGEERFLRCVEMTGERIGRLGAARTAVLDVDALKRAPTNQSSDALREASLRQSDAKKEPSPIKKKGK